MASINTTVHAVTAEEGLAFVSGTGYLSFVQMDPLEYASLYLCRESRRQVARKVRVTEDTPPTLWCRAKGTNASGGARGFTMYPMVEAMLSIENISTGDAIDCGRALTFGGNGGDSLRVHRAQTPGAELQETARAGLEAASPTTSVGGSPRTLNVADEGIVSSAGQGGGANLVLRSPASVPTVATNSLVTSRVPVARVTSILWKLPATELTARGFRWPDGVNDIEFGPLSKSNTYRGMELLSFRECFNGPLEPGCAPWPPGLKRIRFGRNWNLDFRRAWEGWPNSLETLELPARFNQSLTRDGVGLPRGLRDLTLGSDFNQPLIDVEWPPLLQKLTFPYDFDRSLEGVRFPRELREIVFGNCFNSRIDGVVWPKALEILKFGVDFNQPVIGVEWPPLLQKLTFSENFNQSFEGVTFPDGLWEIVGGRRFNRRIDGVVWPKGLKILKIGESFNQALVAPGADICRSLGRKHTLPAGLQSLDLRHEFNHPLSGSELPDGLEVLRLGMNFGFLSSVRWPSELKRLFLHCAWYHDDRPDGGGLVGNPFPIRLPPKLESLEAGSFFNLPLTAVAWPPTLKFLDLGYKFNHPIVGEDGEIPLLPDGLEELRLGICFNHSMENIRLQVGLKRLVMTPGPKFDQDVAGIIWPPCLEELDLGGYFNQPIVGITFPETLRVLWFGSVFEYSLQGVTLPDGLTCLSFSSCYPVSLLLELDWSRSLRRVYVRVYVKECLFESREALAGWVAQRLRRTAA